MPPSSLISVLRWKPVAICCSRRGVRQHVAGDLLDRELVERHVAVEGVDHPVAVLPHRCGGGPSRSRWCRRSGRGRARGAPSARRSAARRAADRRPSRRRTGRRVGARKASISSGVGGRPIRSRVTRRDERLAARLGRRLRAPRSRAARGRSGRSGLLRPVRLADVGDGRLDRLDVCPMRGWFTLRRAGVRRWPWPAWLS